MAKFQCSVFVIYTVYADCMSCTQYKLVGTSKILSVVIPMKTVTERPIREVDQGILQRTTVILAVLQQEAVSWILFSAVVPVLSSVLMHGLGYLK